MKIVCDTSEQTIESPVTMAFCVVSKKRTAYTLKVYPSKYRNGYSPAVGRGNKNLPPCQMEIVT
jgi:hypothetical protein